MKILFIAMAALLLTACNNPKSTNTAQDLATDKEEVEVAQNTELEVPETVADIKAVYNLTTNQLAQGQLDSVSYKYNCANEQTGTITYFSDKEKLRLVKHSYAEYDHHNATDQFYVLDDVVYFVFYNRISWSFVSGSAAEGATKDDVTEQRFYLVKNEAIQCLEKKYSITSEDKKSTATNAENKVLTCGSSKPLITAFEKLIAFKNQPKKDCFGK